MRTLPSRISWILLLLTGVAAHAQNPFTIAPSMVRSTNGAAMLRVTFGVPTNHFLYADKLSLTLSGEAAPADFRLPEPRIVQDKFSGKQKRVFSEPFQATCCLPAIQTGKLALTIHFQGCDDANCFFPEDKSFTICPDGSVAELDSDSGIAAAPTGASGEWRTLAEGFTVAAQGSGYLKEKEFLTFLDQTQSRESSSVESQAGGGLGGLLLMICLIVVGGAALNLTPCVLPMIPINIAIIGAGAQAGSKRRGFALGATYAAGMAIAYGALGVVVVLTGSRFGTLNSSPWFNLIIAVIFGVLALAMFDVLAIDLSRFQGASGAGSAKSKFAVAYTMGTVAALLAGACVAPVVISVLLQATSFYNQGITAGLLLPFLLGLGMGLPWPFAGAGLSFLPKPGRWMTRVKYGFGVFILLFTVYYGHLSFTLFQSAEPLVASATTLPTEAVAAASVDDQLAEALREAQSNGQPVFIDFWASWCKNCSAMEHTTFESARVKERLAGFRQVRLQTEHPNQPPSKAVLDHFKVMGLPSYVILKPKNATLAPPEKPASTASVAQ